MSLRLLCFALLATVAGTAGAQYKIVAPDGSVTYTDRPPAASNAKVTPIGRRGTASAASPAAENPLPAELRQAAARYPVTLYSAPECPPCDAARSLLQQRGIPYSERRVADDEDAAALERAVGARTVPALTIGAQALRGLSPSDWNAYLDAAGYPRESKLPRGWTPPAPAPMVERAPPPAAAQAAPPPAPEAAAPPPLPEPAIRF